MATCSHWFRVNKTKGNYYFHYCSLDSVRVKNRRNARVNWWWRRKNNLSGVNDDEVHSQLQELDVESTEDATDLVINHLQNASINNTTEESDSSVLYMLNRSRPDPPSSPPPLPSRSTPEVLLGGIERTETRNTDIEMQHDLNTSESTNSIRTTYSEQETLEQGAADRHDGQNLAAPVSAAHNKDSESHSSNCDILQAMPVHEHVTNPSEGVVPFNVASVLAVALVYAVRRSQREEKVYSSSGKREHELLQQRLRLNSAANAIQDDGSSAEQRIQEAKAKASKAAEEEAKRQQEYAAIAAREAKRHKELREKARLEYEKAEALKAEELARRRVIEQEILEKKAREREQARIEAEKAELAAKEEEERLRAAELLKKQKEQEEAHRVAEQERKALSKLRKVHVVRVNCRAAFADAKEGLMTSGRIRVPARIEVSCEASNVLAGEIGPITRGAANYAEAMDVSIAVGGEIAHLFRTKQIEATQVQQASGRGPLTSMDAVELKHWMNEVCMVVHAATTACLRKTGSSFEQAGEEGVHISSCDVKIERGTLPQGHPKQTLSRIRQCIQSIQNDPDGARGALQECADEIVLEEKEWVEKTLQGSLFSPVHWHNVTEVCVAALLIDIASTVAPEHDNAAPQPWQLTIFSLVDDWISLKMSQSKPDSLLDIAEMSCWALGDEHPVCKKVLELADENMSTTRKTEVIERQRAMDALVAQHILESERLSAKELSDQQAIEKEAQIPIPERIWALRNIAGTMALGDKRSRAQARKMYELALELQHKQIGDPMHPGMLGDTWQCASKIQHAAKDEEWREKSLELQTQCVNIADIVISQYRKQEDLLSATLLAEATCSEFESQLGPSHPLLARMTKSAQTMFDVLETNQQEQVCKVRKSSQALEKLSNMFTQSLGVRSSVGSPDIFLLWDCGDLPPLV